MTHDQAMRWYDTQADSLQRAGVRMRLIHALRQQDATAWSADDDAKKSTVETEWVNAVSAEIRGDKLP